MPYVDIKVCFVKIKATENVEYHWWNMEKHNLEKH